jgi:hypothetical protein
MDADKLDELEQLQSYRRKVWEQYHLPRADREHGFKDIEYAVVTSADASVLRWLDNALEELVAMGRRVAELEGALAEMSDCQPLPKIYKYTGTAEVDVENMFDVGHRHANGRKPYDYLKSWLSMLRPFAYATQDDSWGEMEKLLSIVMNNYVQTLVKAEAARAALQTKGPTT